MGSAGIASFNEPDRPKPKKKDLPTPFVQGFRELLDDALKTTESGTGKKLSKCVGVYAFFDYDDEPIYVGQTKEDFGTRIGRHLRGQRSDTVAYRILDPFEVAKVQMWPYIAEPGTTAEQRSEDIDRLEYSAYAAAIRNSKFKAILNEKIPPATDQEVPLPHSYSFDVIPERLRPEREHPDVRIARRAETLSRLAAVAHERGEVSDGLRRVIVIQAVRLADLASSRLAFVEGRPGPRPDAVDVRALVGNVLKPEGDSTGGS